MSQASDAALLAALRSHDEAVFASLVDAWSPAMLQLARRHVASRQAAEDSVQDAWLGVIRGLDGFEGRASLRSWVFTILVNRARTRAVLEARRVPWSPGPDAPAPEGVVLSLEARREVRDALGALPPRQAEVVRLRDVRGLDPEEVCRLLGLTAENQRVLLHRGRSKLRGILRNYVRDA